MFSSLIAVILFIILFLLLPVQDRSLINILGIIGFLLSVLGILISYFQILSIKDITIETQKQVNESIRINNNFLMLSDLSRKAAMVDEIQGYLKDGKIEMCLLRMKDLKVILNSLRNQDYYSSFVSKKQFRDVFQNFNIDLDNFHKYQLNTKNRSDKELIIKNLEGLSTLLLGVESKLKTNNNDS
ncbi:MAG: hypothetical protein EOP34_09710 [Rickettsiales bacterium]|nr:MAG: hypothetical protein EOP34_09710 [Rickettsiales bacterium]